MNKRQICKISIILALSVFIVSPIFASATPSAGIKPANFFYFLDTAFEKINLFFTFNPEKKAQKAMEYAEERLAEVKEIANENKPDAIATAMANYQENISLATKESKVIKDETKAENLLLTIADNTSKHQEVLADVLSKVPEEAKKAITKAIEISKKGQEEAMKQIAELKGEVEQLKQEMAELKTGNKEQEKAVGEVSKQKPEIKPNPTPTSTSVKPTTASQTSEIIATPKPATTSSQTQTQTNETQNTQPTVQTPSNTTTPTANTNKGEWVLDTRSGSPDYGKQFWVPEGQTLDQVRPIVTSTVTTIALEITSVNVSSTYNTMTFEWTTNKLTQSKIFLSGGNFSSTVYQSESGLSTRHIVHISNLSGNTNYLYEIESIAGEEVVKKQDSFSTKSVKENAEVKIITEAASNCRQLSDKVNCTIEVWYFENGIRKDNDAITISAPDGEFVGSSYPGRNCVERVNVNPITCPTRPSSYDGKPTAYVGYTFPTSNPRIIREGVGIASRIITATANGVIVAATQEALISISSQ